MRISLCAASLTAAAALFTTVPTAAAAPYSESSEFTADQQTLLGLVSKAYTESQCTPLQPKDGAAYKAKIRCSDGIAGAPEGVVYALYDNEADMKFQFKSFYKEGEKDGTCVGHSNPAQWGKRGNSLGLIECLRNEGKALLIWYDTSNMVLTFAVGTDMDELVAWWKKNA